MVGNWKWNVGLGLFAMLFTLVFSLMANTLWTAFVRSCYSFLLFYLIAFIPRFLLTGLSSSTHPDREIQPDSQTPMEEVSEEEFQPASFSEVDDVGRVVRQWSNE